MDIVVTIPKGQKQNIKLEDEWVKDKKDAIQFWKLGRKPSQLNIGDRVYFIQDGAIRYYNQVIDFSKDLQCQVTGRSWPGFNVILKLPTVKLEKPIPMKGFQGFRYFKDDYDRLQELAGI